MLLIDVDTQAQCSYLLGIKPEAGLAEVLTEEITIDEAMVQARKNLWRLAGGRNLAGVKRKDNYIEKFLQTYNFILAGHQAFSPT